MKKILIWVLVIIAVMMAFKNPQLITMIEEKPMAAWHWAKSHVQGFTNYKQENFLEHLKKEKLQLNQREQRYVRNISQTSSELLLFYNRYCDDPDIAHLVLVDPHLEAVCKVSRQVLLLE